MNLGYTGKPFDTATSLYNYGFRDYRPQLARFSTVDPIRDGKNWFIYFGNDPVNYVDYDGLIKHVLVGAGVGAVVGGTTGAISAAIQGKSGREILASAAGGAVSGAVTGAIVASGAGPLVVVGVSFIGGATGSLTDQAIANDGLDGLNAKDVAVEAAIAGGISAAATGLTMGMSIGANYITNNAWNSVAALTNTMNGTWGPTAISAHNTQKIVMILKPIAETALTPLEELSNLAINNLINNKGNAGAKKGH